MLDGDPVFHAEQCGEFVGRHDERRCDIDATYRAMKALREITGRPAQTATDIEYVVTGLDRKAITQFDGGRKSAGVKMIDRRQILDCQLIQRLGCFFQCRQDQGIDIAPAPMVHDRIFLSHICPP